MNQATRINARISRASMSANRRGVAMLLVIIALGAATILTTAFISSRSDSADISSNMQEASQSYWSAKSAMDVTEAILESDIDWITAAGDGTLVNSMTVAGADVQIKMTNLAGDNPTDADTELVVTAVATYNGVKSVFQALVTRQPVVENIEDAIDPEMKEFALFARTSLAIDSGGVIGVWRASPDGEGGRAANMGVAFNSTSNLNLHTSASINRTKFFVLSTASAGLKEMLNSERFIGGGVIPAAMPIPFSDEPSWANSAPVMTLSKLDLEGQTLALPAGRYGDVDFEDESVISIGASGQSTQYVFNDLKLENQAVLVINGDVHITIQDNLQVLDRSTIEMADGSNATFHVRSDVYVDNSVIGFPRSAGRNGSRSSGTGAAYMEPTRVKFFLTNPTGFDPDPEFALSNRAMVIASVHAPKAEFKIESNSALYGRATASIARIYGTGKLYYDPRLDPGVGFTALDGPLYEEDGTFIGDVLALLDEVPVVNTVIGWLGALGGGGGDDIEETDDEEPTRNAKRVKVKVWPLKAHAMENARAGADSDEPDGSFLIVKGANDAQVAEIIEK